MTDLRATDVAIMTTVDEEMDESSVSWAAVAAGAFAAAAVTLLLMAFGAGMGFSAVSPWGNSGVSATTFSIGTGLYLIVAAMLASTIGGYIAGRLRTRWVAVHDDEVFFRDTAHGFLAWACATVLSAALLGAAGTAIVSGTTAGLWQRSASDGGPADIYVDHLFRAPAAAAQPTGEATAAPTGATRVAVVDPATRAEADRVLLKSLRDRTDLSASDRSYLAQLVAARTGMNQADAEKRVTDVSNEAKSDLDKARSAAAKSLMWLTAALLAGALAASLAAIEGGQLRDRRV
jgi:hypothetical protein